MAIYHIFSPYADIHLRVNHNEYNVNNGPLFVVFRRQQRWSKEYKARSSAMLIFVCQDYCLTNTRDTADDPMTSVWTWLLLWLDLSLVLLVVWLQIRRENVCKSLNIEAPETSYVDILQRLVRRYLFKLEREKLEKDGEIFLNNLLNYNIWIVLQWFLAAGTRKASEGWWDFYYHIIMFEFRVILINTDILQLFWKVGRRKAIQRWWVVYHSVIYLNWGHCIGFF